MARKSKAPKPLASKSQDRRLKSQVDEHTEVFTSPESSNVEGGSYIRSLKEAVIAFRDKKNPDAQTVYYSYVGLDAEDWDGLVAAESKGHYMAKVIAKKYRGKRVA